MGLEFMTIRKSSCVNDANFSTPNNQRASNVRLLIAFWLFLFYLGFGAFMFNVLESSFEKNYAKELRTYLTQFLDDHSCLSYYDMENLIRTIVEANEKGISPMRNVSDDNNWKFGQSFFFSGTLVTTVGFGHVSPNSQIGKGFTIAYCVFGIPMFLIVLGGFVERFKYSSNWLLNQITLRFGHLCTTDIIRLIHLASLFFILLLFMFILPAALFTSVEDNWTFLDAFYYCFVSLTTIGLGDYIPGDSNNQSNRALYKIFVTSYLLLGILCMMLFMTTIYEVPIFNVNRLFLLGNNNNQESNDNESEKTRITDKERPIPNYTRQLDDVSVTTTTTAIIAEDNISKDNY